MFEKHGDDKRERNEYARKNRYGKQNLCRRFPRIDFDFAHHAVVVGIYDFILHPRYGSRPRHRCAESGVRTGNKRRRHQSDRGGKKLRNRFDRRRQHDSKARSGITVFFRARFSRRQYHCDRARFVGALYVLRCTRRIRGHGRPCSSPFLFQHGADYRSVCVRCRNDRRRAHRPNPRSERKAAFGKC